MYAADFVDARWSFLSFSSVRAQQVCPSPLSCCGRRKQRRGRCFFFLLIFNEPNEDDITRKETNQTRIRGEEKNGSRGSSPPVSYLGRCIARENIHTHTYRLITISVTERTRRESRKLHTRLFVRIHVLNIILSRRPYLRPYGRVTL